MSPSSWWLIAALLVTSASAVIALLKEKREKKGKRWHRNVLFGLTFLGLIVGLLSIRQADKDTAASEKRHKDERAADGQRIAGLTQSVENQIRNNETQYSRNQEEIHRLGDQLSDLKKQVATEEVRKKMDALQAQLDKALRPALQAKLQTSFWMEGAQDDVVREIYAPVSGNVVSVNLTEMNLSDVNAKPVAFWLRVCTKCKFHVEPKGFEHVAGAADFERLYKLGELPAGSRSPKLDIEIEVPEHFSGKIELLTRYRCENCEIEKNWQSLLVTLGRTSFHKP